MLWRDRVTILRSRQNLNFKGTTDIKEKFHCINFLSEFSDVR